MHTRAATKSAISAPETGSNRFKAKFNPQSWEPIYAIAEGASFSPTALYAIAGAFSGGAPIRLIIRALLGAALEELASLSGRPRSRMRKNPDARHKRRERQLS